ncbi:protein SEED AND ROOT HAIR PROTECTIVE PROTEIN isoform X2 [Rosa chinensis]|nr:protein SEED AND ROOT HAIR PROTECTIVE PROTEIN isoform X2 [Rosa chinensis]
MVVTVSAEPEYKKPKLEKENLLSTIVGIQGLVYCKSGPKVTPLEGSVARITCDAVDEYGFETAPITILSDATDAKGYFLATISPFEIQNKKKLTQCKAFLELSPLDSCNVLTDANNGISGALLTSYHLLHEKNMKLFTVGPFICASESKPVDNGY